VGLGGGKISDKKRKREPEKKEERDVPKKKDIGKVFGGC